MSQWYGVMNLSLPEGWACQTCEEGGVRLAGYAVAGFTWGLVHGTFRCDRCHTQYTWRNGKEILDSPLCRLREEYVELARRGWKKFHTPISGWTDQMWEEVGQPEGDIPGIGFEEDPRI